MTPTCLDLPGPSRRIRVEPLRLPAPAVPAAPAAPPAPSEPAEPVRTPEHEPEREPVPA